MEFFSGCEVKAGVSNVSPKGGHLLHLSEGALGKVKKDHEATIFVKVDDRKLSIGTLSTDKSLQVMFDLVFKEEFELLHTSKSSSVIFSGYKGIQQGEGEPKDEEEGQKIVAAAKEDDEEEGEKIAPAPKDNVKAEGNDKKPEHVNIDSADVESILLRSKKDEDIGDDSYEALIPIEDHKQDTGNETASESPLKTPAFVTPQKPDTGKNSVSESLLETPSSQTPMKQDRRKEASKSPPEMPASESPKSESLPGTPASESPKSESPLEMLASETPQKPHAGKNSASDNPLETPAFEALMMREALKKRASKSTPDSEISMGASESLSNFEVSNKPETRKKRPLESMSDSEISKKPETGKKRPLESSLKTLASNKKAKVATLSGQNTGCEVKAGESKVSPEGDHLLHLSEGALGKVKKDQEATMFMKVDNRKLSVGTFSTNKFLQVMFDLVFKEEIDLLDTSKSSSVFFSGYKGIQQVEGGPKDEKGQKIAPATKENDEEREKIAPAPKENVKAQANDKKPEHVNIESADVESILGKSKKDEDSDEDVESILGKSKKDEDIDEDIDEDSDDGSFDKWLPIQDYEVAEYYFVEEEETPL
ncbi:transcription initiation factor TFIID subunit 11-like isoform X2 [Lolium rigidum]|uniref:transcription initiation factor TFIID subunit 11-like isoform X2 n=1 Tax=Lolium rigidum TaxID=89674 RepID=UPI001F5D0430|nr:transcription initiation factor TFIID subunit 11-like isoform X2 [Lolium rigidum]